MTSLMARAIPVSNCITNTNRKILVLEENKSQLILENKKQSPIIKIKLDGCYAQDTTEKCCDYLVQHNGINYYIELKGVNYEDAFAQIISAIKQFNQTFNGSKCRAIIVMRKSPKVTAFNKALKKSELWRYICRDVIRGSSPLRHTFS